jgi:hypothetical protein
MSAALGSTPATDATTTDETVQRLQQRLAAVESELAEIKANDGEHWLTEQRATQIRSLVQDVLADADTRASLLQDGMVAGYDKGFFLASSDGNFRLKVSGQLQVRYVYNFRDTGDEAGTDDHRQGFEIRRAKLAFEGHVIDPSWSYQIGGGFERDGGAFVLEDAFVNKDLDGGWDLQFGQFKSSFMREENVSSKRQLAVERSLLNEEFNQDRSQGVQLGWTGDNFRFKAMYHDGFFPSSLGTDNTGWQVEDTEWGAITGRVEWLNTGDWKAAFDDFQGWRDSELQILVGGAASYQRSEFGTGNNLPAPDFNNNEVDQFTATADVGVKGNGFGVFGAVVYRMLDPNAGDSIDQFGLMIQGSLFFTDDLEGFARYEWADADISGVDDLNVLTVGANKYWAKHSLKWQNDIGFSFDPVAAIWASSSAGWLADPTDEDGQVVFRSQFQLLF